MSNRGVSEPTNLSWEDKCHNLEREVAQLQRRLQDSHTQMRQAWHGQGYREGLQDGQLERAGVVDDYNSRFKQMGDSTQRLQVRVHELAKTLEETQTQYRQLSLRFEEATQRCVVLEQNERDALQLVERSVQQHRATRTLLNETAEKLNQTSEERRVFKEQVDRLLGQRALENKQHTLEVQHAQKVAFQQGSEKAEAAAANEAKATTARREQERQVLLQQHQCEIARLQEASRSAQAEIACVQQQQAEAARLSQAEIARVQHDQQCRHDEWMAYIELLQTHHRRDLKLQDDATETKLFQAQRERQRGERQLLKLREQLISFGIAPAPAEAEIEPPGL